MKVCYYAVIIFKLWMEKDSSEFSCLPIFYLWFFKLISEKHPVLCFHSFNAVFRKTSKSAISQEKEICTRTKNWEWILLLLRALLYQVTVSAIFLKKENLMKDPLIEQSPNWNHIYFRANSNNVIAFQTTTKWRIWNFCSFFIAFSNMEKLKTFTTLL